MTEINPRQLKKVAIVEIDEIIDSIQQVWSVSDKYFGENATEVCLFLTRAMNSLKQAKDTIEKEVSNG